MYDYSQCLKYYVI